MKSKVAPQFLISCLCFLSLFTLTACDGQKKREVAKIQMHLDESELLIEAREFERAVDKTESAIQAIAKFVEKDREDPELLLLQSRAHIDAFIAKNTLIIEKSVPRARSLVQLPALEQYIDYDTHIIFANRALMHVLKQEATLPIDKIIACYASLGTTYRLNESMLKDSVNMYNKAIELSIKEIEQRKNNTKAKKTKQEISSNTLQRQLDSLKMAQAEVLLTVEEWDSALIALEHMLGGKDLKYFALQFRILENNISDIEKELLIEFEKKKGNLSTIEKLSSEKNKKDSSTPFLNAIGSYSNYESALVSTELELNLVQNNLIYRIICYKWLNREIDLKESMNILKQYYPEIAKNLSDSLEIA